MISVWIILSNTTVWAALVCYFFLIPGTDWIPIKKKKSVENTDICTARTLLLLT